MSKKNSGWKERIAPQHSETRQSTYVVVKLALQDFYCISIPISATVELSLVHHLAQLHCQDYSSEDMQNYISETKIYKYNINSKRKNWKNFIPVVENTVLSILVSNQPAKVCHGRKQGQSIGHLSQNNSRHHPFQNFLDFPVCLLPKNISNQKQVRKWWK